MKKLIAWIGTGISALGISFYLSGCSGSPSTPSQPTPTPVPISTYKTGWNVTQPGGIGESAGATFYVTVSSATPGVELFTSSGVSVGFWSSYGPTTFVFPNEAAVSPVNGNVYVVDGGPSHAVYEFTSAGATVASWSTYGTNALNNPDDLAIGPSGNVYVVEFGANMVDEFTAAGVTLGQWAGDGSPICLAVSPVSPNNVYVGDYNNHGIHEYSPAGASVTQWQMPSSPVSVNYMTVDSSGNVFATGYNTNDVYEYSSNGTYLTAWGGTGSLPGQFINPAGLHRDPSSGDLYVADPGNNRIQVFGP